MVRPEHIYMRFEPDIISLISEVARGVARSMRVTGLNLSEYSEQQSKSTLQVEE